MKKLKPSKTAKKADGTPFYETVRHPAPKSADARAQEMLMWLRKNRIACDSITVGDVSLSVHDLAIVTTTDKTAEAAPPRKSIYEDFGGDALEQARSSVETVEPTEEDDD